MLTILKTLTRAVELAVALPVMVLRFSLERIAFNPRLGPLRYLVVAALAYVVFALALVYVYAPIRGWTGQFTMAEQLRYDAERWVATAIYDRSGQFVGTFDPRHDSMRDVNYTDSAIAIGDHTANPDHKSIPVTVVPDAYWRCLQFHEDRYLGGPLNPYGIDLIGVLKIPYSSLSRSIAAGRPVLGVGGSTLPMQFARVIYKTPPSTSEGGFGKLRRKLQEWWIAPVIYQVLTNGGDDTRLKQWAADHIWLAQRTGGAPLHGVEMTARVVFGKEAKDLTVAEQFVLASAVNKPIILLGGGDRIDAVRLDRWRYITEVRARTCAERLLTDTNEQKRVVFDLVTMAGGPPDPKVKPRLQATLEAYAPDVAKRATANPVVRAAALIPAERFGIREELKQRYGLAWRDHVRGVGATIDVAENLAFRARITAKLSELDKGLTARISPGFTLDPQRATGDLRLPDVIVVAANRSGQIVRYFATGETASYFSSPYARDPASGGYDPARESRMLASVGKVLTAIAIAAAGRDGPGTLYADTEAPATSGAALEGCGRGTSEGQRRASVVFACSLNAPLLARAAGLGQGRIKRLIDRFGFVMPPPNADGEGTPPSTAAVLGQIAGSPRQVHLMSSVVLASLTGNGARPVRPRSLIRTVDPIASRSGREPSTTTSTSATAIQSAEATVVPDAVIPRASHAVLTALLQAPLCHTAGGQPAGTLKSLAHWCAERRPGVRLHFAKTGTKPTADPSQTVDTWITGGVQFNDGRAYSYVVLVGTGTVTRPWGRNVNAAQITPLLDVLLSDLEGKQSRPPGRSTVAANRGTSRP